MVSFVQAQNDIEKLYNRCLVLKLVTFLQLNLKVTYRLSHYKQLILFTRPGLFNKEAFYKTDINKIPVRF